MREAAEELGVPIRLGSLRAVISYESAAGAPERHWCFDATTESDDISIAGGPEASPSPGDGTYKAVWLEIATLDPGQIWPPALARLVAATKGNWGPGVLELSAP
jgi:hypothetical protein